MKRNRKGFTLIELLIVVAIIGIIVAIAIPNLLNAIQRAKQKRSMADMRSIGTAAEAYSIDYNAYPPSAGVSTPLLYGGVSYPSTKTVGDNLANYVSPTYIRVMPFNDGWNKAFGYAVSTTYQDYAIASAGKDGVFLAPSPGPSNNFNTDIVFSDGQFTAYPEGVQQ